MSGKYIKAVIPTLGGLRIFARIHHWHPDGRSFGYQYGASVFCVAAAIVMFFLG